MHRFASALRFSRVLLVVLCLAVGFAAGSVFVAYGAANDTYSACITSKGDIYRVRMNGSWSCLSGDTKISWNQQGPQGLQGLQGIQGEHGQAAVETKTSAQGYVVGISDPLPLAATPFAECDPGDVAIGGGYYLTSYTATWDITGSRPYTQPNGNESWQVPLIINSIGSLGITVFAVCMTP